MYADIGDSVALSISITLYRKNIHWNISEPYFTIYLRKLLCTRILIFLKFILFILLLL